MGDVLFGMLYHGDAVKPFLSYRGSNNICDAEKLLFVAFVEDNDTMI